MDEPGIDVSAPSLSTALRVKAYPGQAWSHALPRRSLGVIEKVASLPAVVLRGASALCVEGLPRLPVTTNDTVSFLFASSARLTRAEQFVVAPVAKSRSVSAGSKRNNSVCCSIRASVPLWPSGMVRKEVHEAPTSTW